MYGASGDAHLRSEVSGACRGLSFVLEALWRICRVYIYRHLRAELLQLARVVTRYVAVRGPGAPFLGAGLCVCSSRSRNTTHDSRTSGEKATFFVLRKSGY